MTNQIHWSKKTLVAEKKSAWHDHSFFEVPFTGEYDWAKISNALFSRLTNNFVSRFGGQTALGEVSLLRQSPTFRNAAPGLISGASIGLVL